LVDCCNEAVLFKDIGMVKGYALFRREAEHICLRQLYVHPEFRRQRAALVASLGVR
jgi:hypothetical protein